MVRRILSNLCALLIGIVFSLTLLEVVLRIYNPVIETVKGESVVLRPNYDEIRQNNRIPGMQNTRIPGVSPVSHIHQNSLGFRSPSAPSPEDPTP